MLRLHPVKLYKVSEINSFQPGRLQECVCFWKCSWYHPPWEGSLRSVEQTGARPARLTPADSLFLPLARRPLTVCLRLCHAVRGLSLKGDTKPRSRGCTKTHVNVFTILCRLFNSAYCPSDEPLLKSEQEGEQLFLMVLMSCLNLAVG